MNAQDLLKMSRQDLIKMFDKPIGACAYDKCGKEVTTLDSHTMMSDGRVYHSDCYWEALGEEIEKHPICSPGRRGIGGVALDESDLEVVTNQ